jgi:hypothetical protein
MYALEQYMTADDQTSCRRMDDVVLRALCLICSLSHLLVVLDAQDVPCTAVWNVRMLLACGRPCTLAVVFQMRAACLHIVCAGTAGAGLVRFRVATTARGQRVMFCSVCVDTLLSLAHLFFWCYMSLHVAVTLHCILCRAPRSIFCCAIQ